MSRNLRATAAHQTHQGQIRQHNEDFVAVYDDPNSAESLYIVADGVGGAEAGDIASKYASERIIEQFQQHENQPAHDRLRNSLQAANNDVRQLAHDEFDGRHMATTAVVALVDGHHVTIANVGDSRAYHWRGGTLQQVTKDQSLVAQLVEEGAITEEEALTHPRRHVILSSLGSARTPRIDLFDVSAETGDKLLLCSDGLTRHVSDSEIATMLSEQPIEALSQALVDLANERGGEDNISVLLVDLNAESSSARGRTGLWIYTIFLAIMEAALIFAVYYALKV